MKTTNLLDSDNPPINTLLLQPTKYEKPKRKYLKKGIFTKAEKLRKKVISIFDQFKKRPGRPKMTLEPQMSWYEKMKKSIIDVFWKRDPEFECFKKICAGFGKM